MTDSAGSDSPAPGGLWNFTVRFDELPLLEAALSGRRLSADEADIAAVMRDRVEILQAQIERQARG